MSASNPTRTQVRHRGRLVPCLFSRERADGTVVFEFYGRLNGKVTRLKLDAAVAADAVAELEALRSGIRERRISVAIDRRKLVRDAADEYLAHVHSLKGTRAELSPARSRTSSRSCAATSSRPSGS